MKATIPHAHVPSPPATVRTGTLIELAWLQGTGGSGLGSVVYCACLAFPRKPSSLTVADEKCRVAVCVNTMAPTTALAPLPRLLALPSVVNRRAISRFERLSVPVPERTRR